MQEYIFQISMTEKDALAALRLMPGLKVAEKEGVIWLRGIPASEPLPKEIWQLPAKNIYTLDAENHLFAIGSKVPIAKLNEMSWLPLKRYITIEPPVSAMKGEVTAKVPVKLSPSSEVHPGQALLTDLARWKIYADTAPLTRLKRLSFAVSESNQVLITGTPLPAIPGREYWMNNDLLLPCGYDFEVPFIATLLPGLLNPARDCIIIFDENGSWQKIESGNFITATRSAVRMTRGRQALSA